MAEFDPWADYYDIIHRGLPGEAEYYVEESLRQGGETLELGCGTGRVCIPMAMSGVRVTGLDISAGMLAVCRRKVRLLKRLKGSLTLIQGDMSRFDLGRRFQFIAMPYRAFMHLLTPETQSDCLACVRRHLNPRGRFVLNLWAARPSAIVTARAANVNERLRRAGRYAAPWGESTLLHSHAARYDEFRQLILERHVIREVDSAGKTLRRDELSLTRAWLTPREMAHLVLRSGFEIEGLWGDFEGTPLDADSNEMIWVLRPR